MLNNIYNLLPADVTDFETLNALPANSQGPQVLVMSYPNNSSHSSVKMDFVGTPDAVVPKMFTFTDVDDTNLWITSEPFTLDANGKATGIYVECWTVGPVVALAGTLTRIDASSSNIPQVTSINNPFDAVVAREVFDSCVDQSTTQDPLYQPWTDAMEANQPIATREVICIETGN